jgi:hypothetical protein
VRLEALTVDGRLLSQAESLTCLPTTFRSSGERWRPHHENRLREPPAHGCLRCHAASSYTGWAWTLMGCAPVRTAR